MEVVRGWLSIFCKCCGCSERQDCNFEPATCGSPNSIESKVRHDQSLGKTPIQRRVQSAPPSLFMWNGELFFYWQNTSAADSSHTTQHPMDVRSWSTSETGSNYDGTSDASNLSLTCQTKLFALRRDLKLETLTNRGIISKDEWDRLSSFLDEMLSNDEGKITISENLSQNFLRLDQGMYLSKCFVDYLHYGSEAQVQEDIQICMEQTIFRGEIPPEALFFSFCRQRSLSSACYFHCEKCRCCCDTNYTHCEQCNKCSFGLKVGQICEHCNFKVEGYGEISNSVDRFSDLLC